MKRVEPSFCYRKISSLLKNQCQIYHVVLDWLSLLNNEKSAK